MKPLRDCCLYTFVDSAYLHGRDPVEIARALCRGGSDLIQLRAKDWPGEKVRDLAVRLLPVTRDHGVRLVINDHLELAREVGAEICHLGQEDFFDAGHVQVTALPGRGLAPGIGLSTHAPAQAQRAIAAGPAYIAIGPVFPTGTKPTARAVTLEYVRWAAAHVNISWFAIGGIHLGNLPEVLRAGATRVCVVSAILNETDVAQAAKRFRDAIEAHLAR